MQPTYPNFDHCPRTTHRKFLLPVALFLLLALIGASLSYYAVDGRTDSDFKTNRTLSDLRNIHTALRTFQLDTDRYPTTAEGLEALVTKPKDAAGWTGPYLDKLQVDGWGHPFHYSFPSPNAPTTFDLHSSGPDGIDATLDDLTKDSVGTLDGR